MREAWRRKRGCWILNAAIAEHTRKSIPDKDALLDEPLLGKLLIAERAG
jgi:hypothetical protein